MKSTRARSPRSLEATRKVLKELKDDSRSTRKPAVLGYKALGGLSEINLRIPARKEEIGLILGFIYNPTRTPTLEPTSIPPLGVYKGGQEYLNRQSSQQATQHPSAGHNIQNPKQHIGCYVTLEARTCLNPCLASRFGDPSPNSYIRVSLGSLAVKLTRVGTHRGAVC